MKKIVHDLSPLACFLFTAAAMSLLTWQLIVFLQKILSETPNMQLMRGF